MDPGPGSYPVRATGNRELMLIKLDAAGNFSWGKHVAGFPAILTYSLKSGRSGNVYMTGRFTGTFDFVVRLTDSQSRTTDRSYFIKVNP